MCTQPRKIYVEAGGAYREYRVSCRYCWQCKNRRVWDWVGRAIAENETCTKAYFVTLTYGHTDRYGESLDERAKTLEYRDIQLWLKRIRKKYNVRYMVTGEYGPEKGRTHWHALLFFYGRIPTLPYDGRIPDIQLNYKYWGNRSYNTDPFWDNGVTVWKDFDPHHAKYVCKYMLKAEEGRLSKAMLSRKPPIGAEYFRRRAEKHVEAHLSPQDLVYSFATTSYSRNNRKPRQFVLQGVSADMYIMHFLEKWREKYGNDNWPFSELIEDYLDAEARPRVEEYRIQLEKELKPAWRPSPEKPPPPDASDQVRSWVDSKHRLYVDEHRNCWACFVPGSPAPVLYWSHDDQGERAWREVLVIEAEARKLRKKAEEESVLRHGPPTYWLSERTRARRARLE